MTCGIYMYENKTNGHKYIGLSNNIERRHRDHVSASKNPKSKDYNDVIHKAFRKYGLENFELKILEECPESKLKEREIYWIEKYNTYTSREHYNQTPGGDLVGEKNIHKGEEHGKAKLTEKDVIACRQAYKEGKRSRDIWEASYKEIIPYAGFLKMWHGRTWKHVLPEAFETNPHRGKYTQADCEIITALFKDSNLPLRAFSRTPECYVGYGTLWKMINEPEFYEGK
jgi:hypothetical protein